VNNKMNDWNQAELRVYGSDSTVHILNGELIFRGHEIQNQDRTPRTKGRIRLQAEGAGIYHRRWMIMELDENGKAKNAKAVVTINPVTKGSGHRLNLSALSSVGRDLINPRWRNATELKGLLLGRGIDRQLIKNP
jgi:hypothetical protein